MRNEYVIDWPLWEEWIYEGQSHGIRRTFYIFWCALFACCLALGVFCVIASLYYLIFFCILMAAFCFYRAFLRNVFVGKMQYKKMTQLYGKAPWTRTISFTDEGIVVKEETIEMKYNYSNVRGIREEGETIYLEMQAQAVIRLYRSKFVDCTWEDCKAKILESKSEK